MSNRRGVSFNRQNNRWRASLGGYGWKGYIGEFATEAEAVAARAAAEIELHGCEQEVFDSVVDGDVARVPITGRHGVLKCWATIDAADVPQISGGSWCMTASGYAVSRIGGRVVYMHRLLMPGGGVADHIDGDKMNNRRVNLRLCSQRENSRNQRGSRNSTCKFKGVRKASETRYVAAIMVDRQTMHLGSFSDPEAAARAYDRAAAQHFGEFARLNFPSETPGVDITISEVGA